MAVSLLVGFLMLTPTGVTGAAAPTNPSVPSSNGALAATTALARSAPPAVAPPNATPGSSDQPSAWTNLTADVGNAPSPRWLSSMVYDPVSRDVLLFGGSLCPSLPCAGLYGDTWTYSDFHWTELSPSTSPSPRYAATMAWDVKDHYAVLFGGFTGTTTLNDTWIFQNGTWTNITATTNQTPGPRWRASMTYDAGDGEVLMFGGTDTAGTAYSDTWAFSGGHWRKLSPSGSPPGRYRASMTYDPADNETVLFGGCTTSSCPDSSTWVFHNDSWKQLSPSTHPSSRTYYYEAYAPQYSEVLLFGGAAETSTATFNDLYSFANATWTDRSSNVSGAPSDRAYGMMVNDPADGYLLLFGGASESGSGTYTYYAQTWALGPPIVGQVVTDPGSADVGGALRINATPYTAPPNITFSYTGLPPGCAPANASVISCRPSSTGNFSISATLTAPSGYTTTENATLTVRSDPTLQGFSVTPGNLTEGSPVSISTSVTGGTPPYRYAYTGLPSGCGSVDRPALNCTPQQNGSFSVGVSVTDAAGWTLHGSAVLVIHPHPEISGLRFSPPTIDLGMTVEIQVNLSGGTAPFVYAYAGLPAGCASADTGTLSCKPTSVGSSLITVRATDAFGWNATANGVLTVNPTLVIESFAANLSEVDVGIPVAVTLSVTGGTGNLTVAYSGGPPGCPFGNLTQATCTPRSPGEYTIVVRVTDALGEQANGSFNLTVAPPPSITGLTIVPSDLDQGAAFTIQVSFQGGTPPVRFVAQGIPPGCAPFAANGVARCTARTIGVYNVEVQVTDAWIKSTAVGQVVTVNRDPFIERFEASQNPVVVGGTTLLSIDVVGGTGAYTYRYSDLPAGCTSANSSTLACRPTSPGHFPVTVTVTDSSGYGTTAQLNLTATAPASSAGSGSVSLAYGVGVGAAGIAVAVVAGTVLYRRRRGSPSRPR